MGCTSESALNDIEIANVAEEIGSPRSVGVPSLLLKHPCDLVYTRVAVCRTIDVTIGVAINAIHMAVHAVGLDGRR